MFHVKKQPLQAGFLSWPFAVESEIFSGSNHLTAYLLHCEARLRFLCAGFCTFSSNKIHHEWLIHCNKWKYVTITADLFQRRN